MIGDRIKLLREERKLSQAELADIVGLAQSSIGNYERGIRSPDADTIVRLANFFNVSADYLLCITDYDKGVQAPKGGLGLQEQAIERLITWNEYYRGGKDALRALSELILDSKFFGILTDIAFFIDCAKFPDRENKGMLSSLYDILKPHGYIPVSTRQMLRLQESLIIQDFSEMLREISLYAQREAIMARSDSNDSAWRVVSAKDGYKKAVDKLTDILGKQEEDKK